VSSALERLVGTDVAIEAAHIALMRDDWRPVPEVLAIARAGARRRAPGQGPQIPFE
jgi:cation transport ATPase